MSEFVQLAVPYAIVAVNVKVVVPIGIEETEGVKLEDALGIVTTGNAVHK